MRGAAVTQNLPAQARARLADYYALCKPRVVMLITFTAIVGMLLAVPALGLTKAVASSNAHPYAQYVAFMLEGDMQGAHDEWKKAKLIAQRQAEMDHQRSMRNTGMSYRDSVANPHSGRSSGASRRSLNQEGITAFSHSPV